MKWIVRLLLFVVTFSLGVSLAFIVSLIGSHTFTPPAADDTFDYRPNQREADPSVAPTGVRVLYAGTEKASAEEEQYLRFVIYNGQLRPISYAAHHPQNVGAEIMVNGAALPRILSCGTGIRTFYILPGSSAEVRLNKWDFTDRPAKGDRITAGFYLRNIFDDTGNIYRTEPFALPEDFRESITNRLPLD